MSNPKNDPTECEWLETNGLGGWASSTASGEHTRRYHGLLVAAPEGPRKRYVLLSRLDEIVKIGSETFELGTRRFRGATQPDGSSYLRSWWREYYPKFEYAFSCGEQQVRIEKSVQCLYGKNSTMIRYDLLEGPSELQLSFEVFSACRFYHTLRQESAKPPAFARQEGPSYLSLKPTDPGLPDYHIVSSEMNFEATGDWYNDFYYRVEDLRGQESSEDVYRHGILHATLSKDRPLFLMVSAEPSREEPGRLEELFEIETGRRKELVTTASERSEFSKPLVLAADQFLVRDRSHRTTVIAGYPWFTDWGRDTMIALPGLCLETGRLDEAKEIIKLFIDHAESGLIPNRFSDESREPEYNTVDATLWLFEAVHQYFEKKSDDQFLSDTVYAALKSFVDWHVRGTHFGIAQDTDGLLKAGSGLEQLTWMDAKIGDLVVTPRHGKAVEVNALWINALWVLEGLAVKMNDTEFASSLREKRQLAEKSFIEQFWITEKRYLFDVITSKGGDDSFRPNQLFALSLSHEFIPREMAISVLALVRAKLRTPAGIRTLSPDHKDFVPRYEGDLLSRDKAYHQGAVWPWLSGPYLRAFDRYLPEEAPEEREIFSEFLRKHMGHAGLGTVSEIFDATEPHLPRGCIGQAWSVAELLSTI